MQHQHHLAEYRAAVEIVGQTNSVPGGRSTQWNTRVGCRPSTRDSWRCARFPPGADTEDDYLSTSKTKVADHRLRQHRHRPDDQGPPPLRAPRDGRDGRHRPGLRRPGPRRGASACRPPHEGVDGLIALPGFDDIEIVFDATSAKAHVGERRQARAATASGSIDLTPAAIGPYVVPAVNLDEHLRRAERQHGDLRRPGHDPDRRRGLPGRRRCRTPRSSPRSRRSRPGPGTRANIDEFTETTSHAIETVGGAARGKAIIILNPAEPPLIMRDTVFCLVGDADRDARRDPRLGRDDGRRRRRRTCPATGSSRRCRSPPVAADQPVADAARRRRRRRPTHQVSVFLEVEGAAHYLPPTPATSTS